MLEWLRTPAAIVFVFGIVIFTLLVQGGTADRLLRWSGVSEAEPESPVSA